MTTIYVTHDQVEAMTMGDRVAVMSMGLLQQIDEPQRLYDEPANLFVASFIGTPPMSLLEADVDADATAISLAGVRITLDGPALSRYPVIRARAGKKIVVGVRPEDVYPGATRPELPHLDARLELIEALGSGQMAYFSIDAVSVRGAVVPPPGTDPIAGDGDAELSASKANLTGHFPPRVQMRLGDSVPVALDTANMHFFDHETGAALR